MGIFELAAELGKTLKNDKRLIALEEARKAYENDERVGKLMTEYEVQQKAIQNEVAKAAAERNDELLKMIQARIDAIYDQIVVSAISSLTASTSTASRSSTTTTTPW